jgi:hypothetical protein
MKSTSSTTVLPVISHDAQKTLRPKVIRSGTALY